MKKKTICATLIFMVVLTASAQQGDISISKNFASKGSIAISIQPRWNMISIPVDGTYLKNDLFPSSISSAYFYNPDSGSYLTRDTLVRGKGYWLKFPSADTSSILGKCIFLDTVAVKKGWNMIGSISVSVPVYTIGSDPPGIITSDEKSETKLDAGIFYIQKYFSQKITCDVHSSITKTIKQQHY